jgi:hypothetical protein
MIYVLIYLCLQPFPLNETVIREVSKVSRSGGSSGDNQELLFQIVHIEDVVTLRAPDKKSKSTWMRKIETANSACLKIEKEKTLDKCKKSNHRVSHMASLV